MTTHAEERNMPYTPQQLFALVAGVEKYPEFLPWCLSSKVTKQDAPNIFYADLVIGYKMIKEKFGSKVTLNEDTNHIYVEYLTGPMKHLSNHWKFSEEEDGSCTIDFFVDFEFKNKMLQGIMGVFFNESIQKMVSAFEARAKALYGYNGLDQNIKSIDAC